MIKDASDRVEVVFQMIVSKRLDDHPRPVFGQRLLDMLTGADRITHVMQAIKKCNQIIAARRKFLGAGLRERDAVANAGFLR